MWSFNELRIVEKFLELILTIQNRNVGFLVYSDAFKHKLRCILMQNKKVIANAFTNWRIIREITLLQYGTSYSGVFTQITEALSI